MSAEEILLRLIEKAELEIKRDFPGEGPAWKEVISWADTYLKGLTPPPEK